MTGRPSTSSSWRMLVIGALVTCVAAACVLAVGALVLRHSATYAGRASGKEQRIPAPDGKRVLVTSVNRSRADPRTSLTVEFEIRDVASADVVFRATTAASARMRWSMAWLGNRQVKLFSSDIGDYCWSEAPDGGWSRSRC